MITVSGGDKVTNEQFLEVTEEGKVFENMMEGTADNRVPSIDY